MTSENAAKPGRQPGRAASENTKTSRRSGRAPALLPAGMAAAHAAYVGRLAWAPLSPETLRTHASKVRTYLAWLDSADGDFYTRAGLGPAAAERLDLPATAPRALTGRAVTRWLRAAKPSTTRA